MRLRFSDGHSFAETFECNDVESLRSNGMAAIRIFRKTMYRQFHRGEIHKNVVECRAGTLHLQCRDTGAWVGMGEIKTIENSAITGRPLEFLEPRIVQIPFALEDTIDIILIQDNARWNASINVTWKYVRDTWQWSNAFTDMTNEIGDQLAKAE